MTTTITVGTQTFTFDPNLGNKDQQYDEMLSILVALTNADTLGTSGVIAGTYTLGTVTSIAVNAQGRITNIT